MFQFQCGILYITFSFDLIYFPLKEAGHDGLYLHDLHRDLLAGDVVLELLEAPSTSLTMQCIMFPLGTMQAIIQSAPMNCFTVSFTGTGDLSVRSSQSPFTQANINESNHAATILHGSKE